MKRFGSVFFIIMSVLLPVMLCACTEPPAEKTRFGSADVFQNGKVLKENTPDDGTQEEESGEAETTSGERMSKTSTQLDVNELPAEISRMEGLCDAINMTCVQQQKKYTQDDQDFMWHSVHLYVANCTDRSLGFRRVKDYVDADPDIVNAAVFAMFGKSREIPAMPVEAITENEDGSSHIKISNDMKYRFSFIDRGDTASDTRRVTKYSDGSMEMEVALVDTVTGEEFVSFIYTLRDNTRNTTTNAVFAYEITGSRPADKITSDKISGTPFLTTLRQVYGYDAYPGDEALSKTVEEVLKFSSFSENVPGMEELNLEISQDILEYADEPVAEGSWHEIMSYPLTTDGAVQVAVTFETYPNDGSDPDIRCYNYDKKKMRAMNRDDALAAFYTTAEGLDKLVTNAWSGQGTLTDAQYRGLMVRADDSVDVFYVLYIDDAETGSYRKLVAYNSATGSLRYVSDGGGVIPQDEADPMKPPLTHGRKGN